MKFLAVLSQYREYSTVYSLSWWPVQAFTSLWYSYRRTSPFIGWISCRWSILRQLFFCVKSSPCPEEVFRKRFCHSSKDCNGCWSRIDNCQKEGWNILFLKWDYFVQDILPDWSFLYQIPLFLVWYFSLSWSWQAFQPLRWSLSLGPYKNSVSQV